MWTTRVERDIAAAHHNGPPMSRCFLNHGHTWHILVQFTYTELDAYGWGPDFAVIKKVIERYDHQDLNELLTLRPSAENFAQVLFNDLQKETQQIPDFVQVEEGNGNSVIYKPS